MATKNGIRKAITTTGTTSSAANDDLDFKTKAYTIAMDHPTPRMDSGQRRCVGADPLLFDPTTVEELAEAKTFCDGCPARFGCLSLGLARGEWGVWGGVLLEGGKRLDAPRQPGRPKKAPAEIEEIEAIALG